MADTRQNRRARDASDERQARVVELYLTGHRIASIVRELGVSTRTVMRDLKRAREAWKEKTSRNYDDLLPEYLEKLQAIWEANWDGWRRSLEDARSRTKSDTSSSEGGSNTVSVTRSRATGNPKYLAQLERILRTECELRGLMDKDAANGAGNAPQVQEVVITSHEEYAEFQKTLSMEDYKKQLQGKTG